MILTTERLCLREMTDDDFSALCEMLMDDEVMYAYEGAFDEQMARDWLCRQQKRYAEDGFGLWAVILKATGEMIGQCGLTKQEYNGEWVTEIGYLFCKRVWHNGYATEAAAACKQYAFESLGVDEVYSIIRDTNAASKQVAIRNGMVKKDRFVKRYRGVDMPHDVYCVKKKEDFI